VDTGSATSSGGGEDGDVLVLIGGLPGVGKTTVAREVARRTRGAHVRIDALEAGLVDLGLAPPGGVGAAGYGLALTVADTLLAGGAPVIADAVFPVAESRAPWTDLARRHGVPACWVRLVCGDAAEHRRRVEERSSDLPGLVYPDWAAVTARDVDDWAEPHTVVDTADGDPVAAVLYAMGSASAG
jgi:predicted kinase